jgi:NADH:ubiquinone oxidoreductase subunit 5 (subunit L)/multisubunit Na+/H+ antiporter MnhA subunit
VNKITRESHLTMNNKNGSLGSSIYDYTTNYTLYMKNISIEENAEQLKAVLDMFMKNDKVFEDPANILVISLYAFLVTAASKSFNDYDVSFFSIFLVFGNLMVMSAVLRRKKMRTARNIFIFNLALSDFLLATSIPFTVFDALTRAWPLPYSWIGCKYA